jgi:hypothetical protein
MKIDLSIDFGGSGIKVIASVDGDVFGFRLAPEIIRMIDEPPDLSNEFGGGNYIQNMWVGDGQIRHAIGLFARREYLASIPLVAPKSNYVVPRTMASVAVAMNRYGATTCDLRLQLLFPSAEFERTDMTAIAKSLKDALASFESPTGRLKAKLKACSIKPEGWGLTRRYMTTFTVENQPSRVACIMFGHRNTSLYVCSDGRPSHYRSNNLGFIRAIEYAKLDQLEGLKNPSLIDERSLDKYWLANADWLSENLPSDTLLAVIGGGLIAAISDRVTGYLDRLLDTQGSHPSRRTAAFINGGMPITSHEEANWSRSTHINKLLTAWPENIGIGQEDRRAFADVYCLWATNRVANLAIT